CSLFLLSRARRPPTSTLFPYTTLFRSLSVVRHMADRIGVLYLGKLVELQEGRALFRAPQHPYARMLLDAVPDLEMTGRRRRRVRSEEHTSELQSRENLVCRLLLEKKKT